MKSRQEVSVPVLVTQFNRELDHEVRKHRTFRYRIAPDLPSRLRALARAGLVDLQIETALREAADALERTRNN